MEDFPLPGEIRRPLIYLGESPIADLAHLGPFATTDTSDTALAYFPSFLNVRPVRRDEFFIVSFLDERVGRRDAIADIILGTGLDKFPVTVKHHALSSSEGEIEYREEDGSKMHFEERVRFQ